MAVIITSINNLYNFKSSLQTEYHEKWKVIYTISMNNY